MIAARRATALASATAALLVLLPLASTRAEEITSAQLANVKAAEEARIRTVEKVYGTVVAIYGNNRKGGGSGVLYDADGYALTNYHVVRGAGKSGWAGLADGKMYRWKLIGLDPGGDHGNHQTYAGKKEFPVCGIG